MKNSTTKTDNTYFTGTKFPLLKIKINEMKAKRNIIPAVALISRLFNTGIAYPSTFSPNCLFLFIL